MMRYFDCGYGYSGMNGFGGLFMIFFWIAILILFVAIMRRVLWWGGNRSQRRDFYGTHESERDPVDILKERYAKGEINKNEFDERKRDLAS